MQVFNSPCSGSPWDSAAAAAAAAVAVAGMSPASSALRVSRLCRLGRGRRLSPRLTSGGRHTARGALVVLATPALLRNGFSRSSVTLRARRSQRGRPDNPNTAGSLELPAPALPEPRPWRETRRPSSASRIPSVRQE